MLDHELTIKGELSVICHLVWELLCS